MPELPEVETVKKGLSKSAANASIQDVWMSSQKLRFPLSLKKFKKVLDLPILDIQRRAKYLLFDLGDWILINHLGMTGTWRELQAPQAHDHVKLQLSNQKTLVYNDPRRFGFFDLTAKENLAENIFLKHLGPEPFAKAFSADYLLKSTFKKQAPLKNLIMDQKIVVGVGNIYASEALFLSKINPSRAGQSLKAREAELLIENIQLILRKAIQAGGSYIRDFKSLEGTASFQKQFHVYDKAGQPCSVCKQPIQKITQAGRSTFFCKKCQK